MQLHPANTLGKIESAGDEGRSQVPMWPTTPDPWDFSSANRDEALALLKRGSDPTRTIGLVTGALVVGFALGWAGGFGWYGPATLSALNPVPQTEMLSRPIADTRSGGKTEGARKPASTLGLRTPPVSAVGVSTSAKPIATSSEGAHLFIDSSSVAPPAIQADMTPTGSLAPRRPIMPVPETRPTTIAGWTVLDVQGGTAVLGGPDGVRMATLGDIVPGIGRIDSIVRWGNRWIVATASGLIATP
jgi:hypothetical protein